MSSSPPPQVARVSAPAKVNPWLEVISRRPDGFHELDMWMTTLDLADEVEVQRVDGASGGARRGGAASVVSLTVEELSAGAADGCPENASNLVWRAAEGVLALARARGTGGSRLRLILRKRIPSEAGLGGGSSDAAAAVLGAARVLGLDPDAAELLELLASLGSDCAFFLRARATGAARCGGRGDLVDPCPLPSDPASVALVTPAVRVSTPAVYSALRIDAAADHREPPSLDDLLRMRAPAFCRLEEPALATATELREWRQLLDEVVRDLRVERATDERPASADGGVGDFTLSGSGSSFFAFASNEILAARLIEAVRVGAKARDLGLRHASARALSGRGAHCLG